MKKTLQVLCAVTCAVILWVVPLYAKDITILYTGDTHAMLYQCSCPLQPDGGIARRATLVKQLRQQDPQALLLDSGSFFAGGEMDEYSQNPELDKQRSLVNLKAMELMHYDAATVGDDEFNFGSKFFEDNLGKTKIKFLSCNLQSDNVVPFVIKEVGGVKIGIIGVSNLAVQAKAKGMQVTDPKTAVAGKVAELKKKGVAIIILVSHLGENEDLKLLSGVKDIDVLIVGLNRAKEEPFSKVGSTLVLRPSWQGRRMGKAVLSVKENKIVDSKVEELRLSDKVSGDREMQTILPQCFEDKNCRKEGFIGTCQKPGGPQAQCKFKEADKVNLTIITSKDCVVCNTEGAVKSLKKSFPGLAVSYLYYPEKNSQKLVKDFGAVGLPVYLFGKEIEKEKGFEGLKDKIETKGAYYMLKPQYGGLAFLVNRQKIKGKFDVFMSIFDKDAAQLLEVLKEFKPTTHFLAIEQQGMFGAAGGRPEIEEALRSVCVQKYYPEHYGEYLECRAKNSNSSWWEDCLGQYDPAKIKTCARGVEGSALLKENVSLNKELQIMAGPTYLLDNQQIFASAGVPSKEELKKLLKR